VNNYVGIKQIYSSQYKKQQFIYNNGCGSHAEKNHKKLILHTITSPKCQCDLLFLIRQFNIVDKLLFLY